MQIFVFERLNTGIRTRVCQLETSQRSVSRLQTKTLTRPQCVCYVRLAYSMLRVICCRAYLPYCRRSFKLSHFYYFSLVLLYFFILLRMSNNYWIRFWDIQNNFKQLLDKVFVISRIIKVEVGFISRSLTETLDYSGYHKNRI